MKCCKCGAQLPEDSVSCQFCGERVQRNESTENKSSQFSEAPQIKESTSISEKNNLVLPKKTTEHEEKHQGQNKNVISNRSKTINIAICILLIVLLTGNIVQIFLYKDQRETISELNNEKEKLVKEKRELEDDLNESNYARTKLVNSLDEYKKKSDYYDKIISLCRHQIGYASEQFHVDKGIVVIEKNTTRRIRLIADYNEHVTISTTTNGDAASIEFDESTWYGSSTTLTIKSQRKGITTIEFSNNINNQIFTVLIIVV